MPASQRALPIVWPALRTSSWASSSLWSSTTAAKARSSRARSPGATALHAAKASCARSIAASVSADVADGTSPMTSSVTGEIRVVLNGAHILSKLRRSSQSVTAASKAASSTSAMLV